GVVTQAYGQPDNPVSPVGVRKTPPYLPPRHFADCHNRKRTVELNLTTPYSETNFAVRFRVVCLLLTTSGEVVSVIPQRQEICIIWISPTIQGNHMTEKRAQAGGGNSTHKTVWDHIPEKNIRPKPSPTPSEERGNSNNQTSR
ncbi:TPA: hypothetical protein ACHIDO_005360, partial [Escherichia coli]